MYNIVLKLCEKGGAEGATVQSEDEFFPFEKSKVEIFLQAHILRKLVCFYGQIFRFKDFFHEIYKLFLV